MRRILRSEACRQVRFYTDCLQLVNRNELPFPNAQKKFLQDLRLASQTADFLNVIVQLPRSKHRNPGQGREVNVLGDASIPKNVADLLNLGPNFCEHPDLDKSPSLVSAAGNIIVVSVCRQIEEGCDAISPSDAILFECAALAVNRWYCLLIPEDVSNDMPIHFPPASNGSARRAVVGRIQLRSAPCCYGYEKARKGEPARADDGAADRWKEKKKKQLVLLKKKKKCSRRRVSLGTRSGRAGGRRNPHRRAGFAHRGACLRDSERLTFFKSPDLFVASCVGEPASTRVRAPRDLRLELKRRGELPTMTATVYVVRGGSSTRPITLAAPTSLPRSTTHDYVTARTLAAHHFSD
ncbi:hypothetical protein HPB52_024643 [Rhipicephalus sanguineus]|uniref:Uncharacterized protein n=1 Tax=Rhipicephalus sanguineus TaxID=34632 RepID=A0A9D4TE37_RHISA|nr:hypothetical protein HPB52_024643 [Rhipicephalus sanguineus]